MPPHPPRVPLTLGLTTKKQLPPPLSSRSRDPFLTMGSLSYCHAYKYSFRTPIDSRHCTVTVADVGVPILTRGSLSYPHGMTEVMLIFLKCLVHMNHDATVILGPRTKTLLIQYHKHTLQEDTKYYDPGKLEMIT